jgi:hypothetical protein
LLNVPSLLVALYTPPAYLTFFAVHNSIFHVMPRSLLSKEGASGAAVVAVSAEEDAEDIAIPSYADAPALPAVPPAHSSKRREKKRNRAERDANRKAVDATANASAVPSQPPLSGATAVSADPVSTLQLSAPAVVASPTAIPVEPVAAAAAAAPASTPVASAAVARRPRRVRQEE